MRQIITVVFALTLCSLGASQKRETGASDGGLSAHRVPRETIALIARLEHAQLLDKARSVIDLNRREFPWDPDLPQAGWRIAFLQGSYADIENYVHMPLSFQQTFPFVWQTFFEGWSTGAIFYIASLNGVKTPLKLDDLESMVMKEAWAKRETLPFGMVTEEGIHADKQVLTLLLLQDSFGGSHRKLLFERAANLAPNDTFILELKAKRLMDEGAAGGPVELLDQALATYKKALKAKASKERIKHLKKEMAEAEKKVEWLKRVDEIRRRGGVTRV